MNKKSIIRLPQGYLEITKYPCSFNYILINLLFYDMSVKSKSLSLIANLENVEF